MYSYSMAFVHGEYGMDKVDDVIMSYDRRICHLLLYRGVPMGAEMLIGPVKVWLPQLSQYLSCGQLHGKTPVIHYVLSVRNI